MVQQIGNAFLGSLKTMGAVGMRLAPALALFFAALVVGMIVLWAADRERFGKIFSGNRLGPSVWSWGAVSFLVALCWLTLPKVGVIIQSERVAQRESTYASQVDAVSGSVLQYAPSVSEIQTKTFTRTLTLPPDFLNRIGSEGIQVLSPYLVDPSAENVLKLADTFRRSGTNVVFTREVTRNDATALPMMAADVKSRFGFPSQGHSARGNPYENTFDATYTFRNPGAEDAKLRFSLPLPAASTIRDLKLEIQGDVVTDPTPQNTLDWEGIVPAGQTVTAHVSYVADGSGSWRYEVGSGHRRIDKFHLALESPVKPRFLRGALAPTQTQGDTVTWELNNVMTSQQVDVEFAGSQAVADSEQKALSFLPFSFIGFIVVGLALQAFGAVKVPPASTLQAYAGYALGLFALPVFLLYVPLAVAVVFSGAVATALAFRHMGKSALAPAALCSLLPLAFASDRHSGLLVILVAAAALGLSGRRIART